MSKMKPQPNLKLIALLLPDSLSDQVKKEQRFIANTWGPKRALRTPPHITLIPPISVTDAEENSLLKSAEKISKEFCYFRLQLDGYAAFKPKVIFIHPEESPELNDLQAAWRRELLATMPYILDQYPERPYHPHLTLAHRDVTPEQFKKIWDHYAHQEYTASFKVDSFWILRHETNQWRPEKEFNFGNHKL